jgi:hypothetical protein
MDGMGPDAEEIGAQAREMSGAGQSTLLPAGPISDRRRARIRGYPAALSRR